MEIKTKEFKARYSFFCAGCRGIGDIGDPIRWDRNKSGALYHADCFSKKSGVIITEPTNEQKQGETMDIKINGNGHNVELFEQMARALNPYLSAPKNDNPIDMAKIEELVDSKISAATMPRALKIEQAGKIDVTIKSVHQSFEELLYLVSSINPLTGHRYNLYLYGEPGSGKSTAARQVAGALGLPYSYTSLNPQTPESRLIGYLDASGTYRKTDFYERYTAGGVFCVDEQDNASPKLLTTLNSLLENGHGSFPCGMVERHKDFVLVSTGNTDGRGANIRFQDRMVFDSAFRERFIFLAWDYDHKLEMDLSLAINPKAKAWVKWVQGVRAYIVEEGFNLVVSPRASFMGAHFLIEKKFSIEKMTEMILFKNLDRLTRERILARLPLVGL